MLWPAWPFDEALGCHPGARRSGLHRRNLTHVAGRVTRGAIPFEIIVVDDGSTDDTAAVSREFARRDPEVALVRNDGRHGFGMAVRAGLQQITGDAVAIVMADGSDSPEDLVAVLPQAAGRLRLRLRIALHPGRPRDRLPGA